MGNPSNFPPVTTLVLGLVCVGCKSDDESIKYCYKPCLGPNPGKENISGKSNVEQRLVSHSYLYILENPTFQLPFVKH